MKRKKSQFIIEEPSFETTIILDEEKIKECPYSKEQIDEYLEGLFNVVEMEKDGNTFKNGTLARVGAAMIPLLEKEWFMRLVKEWTLVEKDGDTVLSIENVLENKSVRKEYGI